MADWNYFWPAPVVALNVNVEAKGAFFLGEKGKEIKNAPGTLAVRGVPLGQEMKGSMWSWICHYVLLFLICDLKLQ